MNELTLIGFDLLLLSIIVVLMLYSQDSHEMCKKYSNQYDNTEFENIELLYKTLSKE